MKQEPRVVYISPITPGQETALRAAHDSLSETVLTDSGISGLSAFIGSGYYALVLNVPGDFQARFAEFTAHPQIQEFLEQVRPYLLEPLPPTVAPADSFHAGPASTTAAGMGPTTAQLPLAGEVFSWSVQDETVLANE